jgi:hypothetical protein
MGDSWWVGSDGDPVLYSTLPALTAHRACRKIEWTTQALIGAWHTIVEPSEEEDISLGCSFVVSCSMQLESSKKHRWAVRASNVLYVNFDAI